MAVSARAPNGPTGSNGSTARSGQLALTAVTGSRVMGAVVSESIFVLADPKGRHSPSRSAVLYRTGNRSATLRRSIAPDPARSPPPATRARVNANGKKHAVELL
jgi:hypothetical protein